MIYLDNSATTKPCQEAVEAVANALTENWGNPSSLYNFGIDAAHTLRSARTKVAVAMGAEPDRVFFTSGGTEADNWALLGTVKRFGKKNKHIITTAIEHHAILNCMKELEAQGFDVTYLQPDELGRITLDALQAALRKDTVLVSIMMVNNETGAVMPISQMAKLTHKLSPDALFHTDAVQAIGHIPVNVQELGVDMLSASAHKFNGPKGIGFLLAKRGTSLVSFVNGGQQEFARRAGTENVASIVGMATALKNNCSQMHENTLKLQKMETLFKEIISESISNVVFNGDPVNHLPGLISLSIPGASGESLLHILDLKGIAVSTGAACNSKDTEISHVLKAMNHPEDLAKGTLRVSFGKYNTLEDAEKMADAIIQCIRKVKIRKN